MLNNGRARHAHGGRATRFNRCTPQPRHAQSGPASPAPPDSMATEPETRGEGRRPYLYGGGAGVFGVFTICSTAAVPDTLCSSATLIISLDIPSIDIQSEQCTPTPVPRPWTRRMAWGLEAGQTLRIPCRMKWYVPPSLNFEGRTNRRPGNSAG